LKRHKPGDDLIGELFDRMHDLHFMPDLVTGSDYVVQALSALLPTEIVLVHVFDINAREFVVVRAAGPGGKKALLHRTPDTEPLFRQALRRTRTLHIERLDGDARFSAPRYQGLDVTLRSALCGPVQHGGRYLGIIELLNPITSDPFYESEINALDYICDQFADFVANRPIVLDHEVVIGKS
jgi:GAF domain-containing protein